MTEALSPSPSDQIQDELLSLVRSVKGQVLNAKNLYVEVDWGKSLPSKKNDSNVTQHNGEPLNDLLMKNDKKLEPPYIPEVSLRNVK